MTVEIKWLDGTHDQAGSADEMIDLLGLKQMDQDVDIRTALAKRALFWGDVKIDPEAPAAEILDGLVKAGMLKWWNDDTGETA